MSDWYIISPLWCIPSNIQLSYFYLLVKAENIQSAIVDFFMAIPAKGYDVIGRCFSSELVVYSMMPCSVILATTDLTSIVIS